MGRGMVMGARFNSLAIRAVAALVLVQSSAAAQQPAPRQPNILLIMSDDQGWGDISSHNNPLIETPVLDRLASQGARFDRFFVSPVCAPTRASLLTGRYHPRGGVVGVTRGLETMRDSEQTIAEALRAAGYATGCFGKWHNGGHWPNHPNAQGFDQFVGFCAGHWNNYFDTTLDRNGMPFQTKGYISDVLTDEAIAFIESNRNQPFLCYVPFNAPHGPFQVPDEFFDRCKARGLDDRLAAIYAMVENLDVNIGRLLACLDQLGLADDTIVLFLTDNGANSDRYDGAMRGSKGSVHEGGSRVPLFVRWPGRIVPGTLIKPIAAHVDLMPTLLELCGVKRPDGPEPVDGMSLKPLLLGEETEWPERVVYTYQNRGRESFEPSTSGGAVRSQRYRYVREGAKPKHQLYDMIADPSQTRDIAAENPDKTREMAGLYDAWLAEVSRQRIERMPVEIGHAEAPVVELLAPEAYFSGNVQYKGGNGWANDWLVGWTATDDRVWWDLDVKRPGPYAVTLLYTCPSQDVGATVEVGAIPAGQNQAPANGKAQARLTEAHNPTPLPSPDRVDRGEVYEKVWGQFDVGTVRLDHAGRIRLEVRATAIPHTQAMELKAVRLRALDEDSAAPNESH